MPGILAGYPALLAYAYGSVVSGAARPSSDVDIALLLEKGCGLSAYERLKSECNIAAEVERRCGVREADVRSINDAPLTVQGTLIPGFCRMLPGRK